MGKRGSRRPEAKSTKPPAKPKSSFPRKDPRPPKRGGKKAGASTPAPQTAAVKPQGPPPGATVQPGHLAPSSPVVTPGKRKPAAPENQEQLVPRKLNDSQIAEREHRLYKLYREKRELEREKKRVTADLSRDITALSKEADKLTEEIDRRYELIGQGELKFDDAPKVDNPTPAAAAVAGAAVAAVAAGEIPEPKPAAGRQLCSWCAEAKKADPTFDLAEGFYVDGRARLVCPACHAGFESNAKLNEKLAATWPKPASLQNGPESCPSCGAAREGIMDRLIPGGRLYACLGKAKDGKACVWTGMLGSPLPIAGGKVSGTVSGSVPANGNGKAETIATPLVLTNAEPPTPVVAVEAPAAPEARA